MSERDERMWASSWARAKDPLTVDRRPHRDARLDLLFIRRHRVSSLTCFRRLSESPVVVRSGEVV